MNNIASFKSIIETGYTDKLTVYDYTTGSNADGTTSLVRSTLPKISAAKCRLSFAAKDGSTPTNISSNISFLTFTVFCSPNLSIQKGDYMMISRMDEANNTLRVYIGTASDPLIRVTHQEITLQQIGDA
ncbi:MAG: hypothetical protein PHE51_09700 [Eubacteriales bacterium]|nr:hypothetical protein [Eubacteriales bacterium]